jgi:alkylation response protein AidB-like acyl-CoA dehydrogenase
MEFSFTPEQEDLRTLVRGFLTKHPVRSRAPGCYDVGLWERLANELGLTGLSAGAEHGGAGASMVEQAIVLEETGRALLALPYLSTVVAARFLAPEHMPGIASGETVAALHLGAGLVARGRRIHGVADAVVDGDVATVAIVAARDEDGVSLYAAPVTDRTEVSTLDHSRPAATLSLRGVPATRLDASVDEACDAMHLALAVESLGVASRSLEMTTAHLRARQQFGVPLASFQALRHRVADLAVALEAARSTIWYAVRADPSEHAVLAPMAKLVAADAAYALAAASIQLHGGIGFTWEHEAHRYFKRATVTRLTHGDPVTLRRTVAARVGLFEPNRA